MEKLLGFEDEATDSVDLEATASSPSCSYKLVPWFSWDEWDAVRVSLFSSSSDSVASALRRISAWKSRGCLPVAIEVTASVTEIQQKDPFFRKDLPPDVFSDSDEILAMLYCMAIMRLVNGVIEKTRRKTGLSIADAAGAIGIPRMLIDIRHECSHRELPALPLVRDASIETLGWLKSYYWDPQKKALSCKRGDESLCAKKQFKSKLRELASILRNKHGLRLGSSVVREQRISHYGRNKVLSLMAGRRHTSAGSKKQISKILKILLPLYSSFSTEVVSVLVDLLMKVIKSLDTLDISQDIQSDNGTLDSLDVWKLVMSKLSNKEPTLLLSVLDAVLDMIETEEANDKEAGIYHMTLLESRAKTHQIADLSALFAWLVAIMTGLKSFCFNHSSSDTEVPTATRGTLRKMLIELLRKCLRVAAHGNKQLMDSAIQISQATGDEFLVSKLDKLSMVSCSLMDFMDGSPEMSLKTPVEKEDIQLAAQKLESIRLHRTKNKGLNTTSSYPNSLNRWGVAKSWKPCPLGMLPQDIGFFGRIPVLDCETSEVPEVLERNPRWELNRCTGKREARHDAGLLCDSSNKKMKETVDGRELGDVDVAKDIGGHLMAGDEDLPCDSSNKKMKEIVDGLELGDADVAKDIGGHLMVSGVWRVVGPEDLEAIKSGIGIFA